ncbi:VanZ family protein [Thalassoglobus sp. JC818]|uniref:VanZ family protein n=1 Tax=Thalassoglobus sp. JC818 TaxID=3232136 RepID=UPI003459DE4D
MRRVSDNLESPSQAVWGIRIVWLCYAATLFFFTHTPVPEGFEGVTSSYDKLLHFGAYFVLAVLSGMVFLERHQLRLPVVSLAFGLLLFAAIDEILQGPVGRQPDFFDWVSDGFGAIAGLLVLQRGLLWLPQGSVRIANALGYPAHSSSVDSVAK